MRLKDKSDKKKKNNKKRIIRILIVFLIIISLILLIDLSPVLILYSSKYISKKFFNTSMDFNSLKYNPVKVRLKISGFSIQNKNIKLHIDNFFVDLSLLNTILLNPTLSSIKIESPKMTIFSHNIKSKNNLKSDNFNIFNFPFKINEILLINGVLDIENNNKSDRIIDKLNIIIPGINFTEGKEIKPLIKGFIFDREFNITGKSIIDKDSLTNIFNLDIKNLNLDNLSKYLPEIYKTKIVSGIINTSLLITITTFKNKSPAFYISGDIDVFDLFIKDLWINDYLLSKTTGKINIKNYDVLKNYIELDTLFIKKGLLKLVYSKKEEEKSIFFIKKNTLKDKSIKTNIKLKINQVMSEEMDVDFIDKFNQNEYFFKKSEIFIYDFILFSLKDTKFKLLSSLDGLEEIKANGFFNIYEKSVIFEEIESKKLNINILKRFIKALKFIENGLINKYSGKVEISKKNIIINGKFSIKEFKIPIKNGKNNLSINNADLQLNYYGKKNQELNIEEIQINDLSCSINENENFKNFKFIIKAINSPVILKFVSVPEGAVNRTQLKFINNLIFNNIEGKYFKNMNYYNLNAKTVTLINDINFLFNPKMELNGKCTIEIFDLFILDNKNPVLKISKLSTIINSFKSDPLNINIKTVDFSSPFFIIAADINRKLYLFSIFEIKTKKGSNKKNNQTDYLNIEQINFDNLAVTFIDNSLNKKFSYELHNINCKIQNYPSRVYNEGNISIEGEIQNRNKFYADLTISQKNNIKGSVRTNDLLLSNFSQYFEHYIKYSILSGSLNLSSYFTVIDENLNINNELQFKDLKLLKMSSNDSFKFDLSRIIEKVEDKNGFIDLKIPVKGNLSSPEFDFRKVFFDLFVDVISNLGKDVLQFFSNFNSDNFYDIINFKPGTADFLLPQNEIFSADMIKNFKDKNKNFLIEGYVDKNKDLFFIKNSKLSQLILTYTDKLPEKNSIEEINVLKKVYLNIFNTEPAFNNSNELRESILNNLTVEDADYYSLSYKRILKIKELLVNSYNVDEKKIGYNEKSIFSNPYISGIDNNIGILKSGKVIN